MTCELGCPKRAIYKGEERILVCSDCYPRIEEASSEEARGVIQRLSDALEAADRRATEYAAVVGKVRDYLEEGKGAYAPDLLDILATAPADALREVKAAAWDEGHSWGWSDAQEAHDVRQEMERSEWRLSTPNPYRKEQS